MKKKTSHVLTTLLAMLILNCSSSKKPNDPPENQPPSVPSNPSPVHGAIVSDTMVVLSWDCTDQEGDLLMYDLYLGTENPPPLLTDVHHPTSPCSLYSGYHYPHGGYAYSIGQTIHWQIGVTDESHYPPVQGPIWNFSTYYCVDGLCIVGSYAGDQSYRLINVFPSGDFVYVGLYDDYQPQYQLLVLDVSDPARPSLAGQLEFTGTRPQVHSTPLFQDGNRLYLLLERLDGYSQNQINIVDISNPSSPTYLGFAGFGIDFAAHGVARYGNTVYATLYHVIHIYDVSNPADSRDRGWFDLPGNTDVFGLATMGNYLVAVGAERIGFTDSAIVRVVTYDLSSPLAPQLVGISSEWLPFDGEYSGYAPTSLTVVGSAAYVSQPNFGLRIFDISNPAHPSYARDVQLTAPLNYKPPLYIENNRLLYSGIDGTILYDCSDPINPSEIHRWTDPQFAGGAINGDYMYGFGVFNKFVVLRME